MPFGFLKIGYRNLIKHPSFSFINIGGLAIGIAAAVLLFTVVKYELGYDTFQPDYNRIYHVVTEDKFPDGNIIYNPGVPFPALEALQNEFPQVTFGSLFSSFGSQITVLGNDKSFNPNHKKFIEPTGVFFSEPEFFKVFHFEWLAGTPAVLAEPNQTVLSQEMAEKYFGDWKNAMGKFLQLDNVVTVKVAGILKNQTKHSDFPLSVVTSFKTAKANPSTYYYSNIWNSITSNFQVFLLMPQNKTPEWFDRQLKAFTKKYYPKRKEGERVHFLQPLSELHFDKRFPIFGDHITSKTTIYTLSLIGIFIILMACINFINLSTALAAIRGKEIGVRKVLGSNRLQLFFQIIGETAFIVGLAVVISMILAIIFLPYIKEIAIIQDDITLFNFQTILFLAVLTLAVILLAGIYPATVLSGFKPVEALKNKINATTVGGISLRRGLVVLQFAISQILIIATLIAISQMNFVRNADIGFNQEAILLMSSNSDSIIHSRQAAFKQKLTSLSGVKSVSYTTDAPSSENGWFSNFAFNHKPDEDFQVSLKYADEDYFKTFGIDFLAGREYSKSDTMNELVINQTLLNQLNINDPNQAVGKQIRIGGNEWKTIVGVVKDFKTSSLREPIKPTILLQYKNLYGITAIKLHTKNLIKTQAEIESVWNNYFPEYAFTAAYMDDNINQFYLQENNLTFLYKIFAGLAIFISCLGLYGLVSFMAVQRLKEIGIRKVLGASIKNILFLFSKEFTILILCAALIAIPTAYFFMNQWLQNFTFRIQLQPITFIAAVVISVLVAWIAVGYKSVIAAVSNPVKSLRSE